jgi:hypothetical protein
MTSPAKPEVLSQIVDLARRHDITPGEIAAAMKGSRMAERNKAPLFFAAVGGIFIISGIGAFIGMFWGQMNSASRVIITLGSGIALFAMGVMAVKAQNERYRRATTPLLLIAGFLQPTGLFVLIDEYFHHGSDVRYAYLVVFGIMLVQQLGVFIATRRAVTLFFAIAFGGSFFATGFNLLRVPNEWSAIIIGLSLLCIAYSLSGSGYRSLSAAAFFIGGGLFLGGTFDVLRHSPVELIYLGVTCFMVYVSTVARSTALMIVAVIAMMSYVGYFTEEHFAHSIGWPAALIFLGLTFIGIGIGAVKLKRRYIVPPFHASA